MATNKVMAIDYASNTWDRTLSYGSLKQISRRYAAKKLCLERSTLKRWIRTRRDIEAQKKGSQRNRKMDETTGREPVVDK